MKYIWILLLIGCSKNNLVKVEADTDGYVIINQTKYTGVVNETVETPCKIIMSHNNGYGHFLYRVTRGKEKIYEFDEIVYRTSFYKVIELK